MPRRILGPLRTTGGSPPGAGLVPGRGGEEADVLCAPPPYLPGNLSCCCPACLRGGERTWVLGVLSFHGQVAQGHAPDPAEGLMRPALAPGHRKLCRREEAGVPPQTLFGQDGRLSEPGRTRPSTEVAHRESAVLLGGLLGSGQEPRGRGRSLLVSPFGPAVLEPDLKRRRELLRQDPRPAEIP